MGLRAKTRKFVLALVGGLVGSLVGALLGFLPIALAMLGGGTGPSLALICLAIGLWAVSLIAGIKIGTHLARRGLGPGSSSSEPSDAPATVSWIMSLLWALCLLWALFLVWLARGFREVFINLGMHGDWPAQIFIPGAIVALLLVVGSVVVARTRWSNPPATARLSLGVCLAGFLIDWGLVVFFYAWLSDSSHYMGPLK